MKHRIGILNMRVVLSASLLAACSGNDFSGSKKKADQASAPQPHSASKSAAKDVAAQAQTVVAKPNGLDTEPKQATSAAKTYEALPEELSETEKLLRQDPKTIPLDASSFCAKGSPRVGDACFTHIVASGPGSCASSCRERFFNDAHPLNKKLHLDPQLCNAAMYLHRKFYDNYMKLPGISWVDKPEYNATILKVGDSIATKSKSGTYTYRSGGCVGTSGYYKIRKADESSASSGDEIDNLAGNYFVPPSPGSEKFDLDGPSNLEEPYSILCGCKATFDGNKRAIHPKTGAPIY